MASSFQPKLRVTTFTIRIMTAISWLRASPLRLRRLILAGGLAGGVVDQAFAQAIDADVLLQILAPGDRDLAALLGEHDRQRIGPLGDADRRAVTRPDLAGREGMRVQWQKARGCGNAVALNDHRAVVQLAAMVKNRA